MHTRLVAPSVIQAGYTMQRERKVDEAMNTVSFFLHDQAGLVKCCNRNAEKVEETFVI